MSINIIETALQATLLEKMCLVLEHVKRKTCAQNSSIYTYRKTANIVSWNKDV